MDNNQAEILLKDLQAYPKECEWVEFKENKCFPDLIGEYLSALSNGAALAKQQFGYLVFGIEDGTHRLVGTTFRPKETIYKGQELELWLNINLSPRISFDIFEFVYIDLKFVIFRVRRMREQPISFKGIPYIRIGSSKAKLYEHAGIARKLWATDSDFTFEREICKHDLSEEELIEFIETVSFYELINLPYPNKNATIISKLIQEKIITSFDNLYHVTNLGALLFAKYISNFDELGRRALRVIFYDGTSRINAIKEKFAKKGYAVGFIGLIKYLEDYLPSTEVIIKSTRTRVLEYPIVAIREIVANALIHQDFSIKGMTPKIEVFSNRIEITNPGKPLISTDRFVDHPPVSRNEILARFMYRLNFCEERGSGFDRVIELCEEFRLPAPEIFVEEMFTKVVLYGFKDFKEMDKAERIRICYAHACLKYVSHEQMTNQSLRDRFDVSDDDSSVVSSVINEAIQQGVIKYSDPNNTSKRYAKYVPYYA